MLVSLCAAKGASGVTTSTLALWSVWPRPSLMAECDPSGGDVHAGYLRGETIASAHGLVELLMATRVDESAVWAQTLRVFDDRFILTGLTDAAQAAAVDQLWPELARTLPGMRADVLVDCGRLTSVAHAPVPVLDAADLVVVVTQSNRRAVNATQRLIGRLRERLRDDRLRVLIVNEGEPYGEREIAGEVGVPVIGVLERDQAMAAVFFDGHRSGPKRSRLLRCARTVAAQMVSEGDRRQAQLGAPPAAMNGDTARGTVWPPRQPLAGPDPDRAGGRWS